MLIKLREREEEVRNLYVALTRAKNALYIVSPNGVQLNNEKAKDKSLSAALIEEENFEDILNNLLSEYEDGFNYENEKNAKFEEYKVTASCDEAQVEMKFDLDDFYKKFSEKQNMNDEIVIPERKNRVFPAKTSYSALKKINANESIHMHKKEKRAFLELTTLKSTSSNSKAILRGNIIHRLFERIVNDVRNGMVISDVAIYISNLKKTNTLIKNIKEGRILTEEEFNHINNKEDIEKIENFINSDLMKIVSSCEFCQTEIAFTTAKKAKELYSESNSEIDVILQGVVDLFIRVSDHEALIVDYKTDYVTNKTGEEILREKHKEQLKIYKEAVEDYYQFKKIRTYVYSYVLSRLIEID